MIRRFIALFLLLAITNSVFAEEESTPTPTPRPSLFHRVVTIFHKDKKKDDKKKTLDLSIDVSPLPLKLSVSHDIQVTVRLTNNTGKFAQLDFPTTQRIEVLLRNEDGKMVTQWSENQSFDNDPGYVTLDPQEHVEYTVSISGRDMVPGKPYTLEAFFPNYDKLRVSKTIVPER